MITAQAEEERARLTSPEQLARVNLSKILRKLSRETVVSLVGWLEDACHWKLCYL